MRSRLVEIEAPRTIRLREETLDPPGEREVTVRTQVSAISAGTELLFYRGDLPEGTPLDESLSALDGALRYPVVYGYAAAGEVVAHGARVPESWLGRKVFAFAPHRSHFNIEPDALFPLPDDADLERAALLPTAETAVNFLLDGAPLVGERALVVGQGVVGLMTTCLLSRFPLGRLWSVEAIAERRAVSERIGASRSLDPAELEALGPETSDFDLGFELSGVPAALSALIGRMGVEGRIIVGSWYGTKRAPIDLGTHFHRRRVKLVSSQVSRIGGVHSPRWSSRRRLETAWEALAEVPIEALVSHRVPVEDAAEAYRRLDEAPESCLQVLLTYT